jgi:hypothetical protein
MGYLIQDSGSYYYRNSNNLIFAAGDDVILVIEYGDFSFTKIMKVQDGPIILTPVAGLTYNPSKIPNNLEVLADK